MSGPVGDALLLIMFRMIGGIDSSTLDLAGGGVGDATVETATIEADASWCPVMPTRQSGHCGGSLTAPAESNMAQVPQELLWLHGSKEWLAVSPMQMQHSSGVGSGTC